MAPSPILKDMTRIVLIAFLLAGATPLAAQCPPPADRTDDLAALFTAARQAPTEAEGRVAATRMWVIWADAPDDRAQEMLDLGMRLRESFDYAAAAAAFDALVDYCPDYAEGYNQRAFVAFLRGDHGAALADLDAALDRSPAHVAALSGKALTLIALGRTSEGRRVLERALALNPWLSERHLLDGLPDDRL